MNTAFNKPRTFKYLHWSKRPPKYIAPPISAAPATTTLIREITIFQ